MMIYTANYLILIQKIIGLTMGITDSKQILANIESQYKSLRKYCDPVYGQITVIQNKNSKKLFAMIEKTFLKSNSSIEDYLTNQNPNAYFLKLERYQVCDLSICSDIRLYFFLFEYASHTLEQQITKRQEESNPFTKQEALSVFLQQTQIALYLKKTKNPQTTKSNKFLFSNNHYLCSPILQLRMIQHFFKNDAQSLQDSSGCYLSPEAWMMLQQGQNYRLRQISNRQSSVVFSMGLNFLQCLLLADLSMIYEQQGINYKRLNGACEQVNQLYGQDLYILIIRMIHPDERQRISLEDIKKSIKSQKKIRRSNLQYIHQKSFQIY